MLRLLLLLSPCCLFAAPHSEKAALARLDEDVTALKMSLEQEENPQVWDPSNHVDQEKYFKGWPTASEWDLLRKFAKAVYEPKEDGNPNCPCQHHSLGTVTTPQCIGVLGSNQLSFDTKEGNSDQVPYKVFGVEEGTFKFADKVTCVVSFKGTNPKSPSDLYTDGMEIGSNGHQHYFKTERIKNAVNDLFSKDYSAVCPKGIIATGHSLGGSTALNAAVYGGIRAFTFAGPGPSRGGANKVHPNARKATTTSATLYTGSDTIPFAAKHIGDLICNRGNNINGHPSANAGDITKLNTKGAGLEAALGLGGHSAVIEAPIGPEDPCFHAGNMNKGPDYQQFTTTDHVEEENWFLGNFGHNGEAVDFGFH